jgi:AraC-like DNA-binding protein
MLTFHANPHRLRELLGEDRARRIGGEEIGEMVGENLTANQRQILILLRLFSQKLPSRPRGRLFPKKNALSPMQYVQRLCLHKARALLLDGQTAAEAGFEVDYNSPCQLSREFRRLFGVTPSQVRAA